MDVNQVRELLQTKQVKGLKFIGNINVGSQLAKICGKYMKKATFELGGNDAFIVLNDANIDEAVEAAYKSRLHCNGQAAVNAKRFIVHDEVYDEFRDKLIKCIDEKTVIGDPFDPRTTLGPLGHKKSLLTLRKDVHEAVSKSSAYISYGDLDYLMKDKELRNGYWQSPIVIENITQENEYF